MHGNRNYNIVKPNGETVKGAPEVMDICPDCFKKFCDWIKSIKEEKK